MAKKLGIDNNSTNGENNDTTKTKTQGLHNELVSFLSIARQDMLTWMMQSMSTSRSTEMQQQYANEIMKQQILKICLEKCQNGIHNHTNTTTASEPPVEEVRVAISSMIDTETNSGVMEQCHNTTNDEDDDDVDVTAPM